MRELHSFRLRATVVAMTVTLLLLAGGPPASADVGGGPPPAYFVDESKLPFTPLPGSTAYWGVHAGAGFRAEVPANWNGDLVVYAHGFRGNELELTVEDSRSRTNNVPLGFAWAASSYDRNGYDVSSGVKSTHALVQHLRGLIGNPRRVYLVGVSLGGQVIAVMIEQYPNDYDGAMPVCAALGGYELFDYYADFNLAAQQLGTGSSQLPVDPATWIPFTVPQIKANLSAVPGGWPNALNADGQRLKNLTELRSGGERPNFDQAWFFWNTFPSFVSGPGNFLFDFAPGAGADSGLPQVPGLPAGNSDVVYQFDSDPSLSPEEQAFNDGVLRFSPDPQARVAEGLRNIPQISGDIGIPVLTLANLGDLLSPFLHEVEYVKRVDAHGKRDLLVQRAIRGALHCDFTDAEGSRAFLDLVSWVETGVKPAGDDVLDPAAVAHPNFGCAFTQGSHLLAAPCP